MESVLETLIEWLAACFIGTKFAKRWMRAPADSFGCALRTSTEQRWRNGLVSLTPDRATFHRRSHAIEIRLPLSPSDLELSRKPRLSERLVLHGADRVVTARTIDEEPCELATHLAFLRRMALSPVSE